MNGEFQRAAIAASEPGARAALNNALESAAQAVDIDRVGARLVRKAPMLGISSWRRLAFDLCRWAEGAGVLDELFPLESVGKGE